MNLRKTPVELRELTEDEAGQRLDNFLFNCLKTVPKSRIYRMIRKGECRVNSKRINNRYRLQAGDKLRIPPLQIEEESKIEPMVGQSLSELLTASILYEDDYLLVINKPAGIAVHGGSGLSIGLIEALRQMRPDNHFLELVHRIDKDTSGCLLLAKKRAVLRELHALLRDGAVKKRYLALVEGKWSGGKRLVNQPLLRRESDVGEQKVIVSREGKRALTLFKPEQRFEEATLLEAELATGRTHQIRVHAAHIHHPIAGDDKYGDRSFNRSMRKLGCKRMYLHAHRLEFVLPKNGQKYRFTADLDAQMLGILARLTKI